MFVVIFLATALAAVVADPPPPPPITLKTAIAEAQRNSPLHVAAAAVVSGTGDAARAAGRLPNPLFDFRTENWTPSAANQLPLDIWATVSQPIELGDKRTLRRAVADADHDGATADLASVDRQLALRTAQFYLQALRARGAVETLTVNREGLATIVRTMTERVGEGYVAESDLLRFEAEAARLDIDIVHASLDLSRSLDALTAAVGLPQRIDPAQLVTPAVMAAPSPDSVALAAAVSRHPDLLVASARVTRARQVNALEQTRRLPDPAVTTGFKRTLGVSTVVAAVTTTIPLFDQNGVSRATALGAMRAAEAEREALRIRLTADATATIRAAHQLADRAAQTDQTLLAPAATVREAARAAFREGSVDVLKLIDAERVYGEVRRVAFDLQLEAIGAAIEARINLGEDPLP